MKDQKLEVMEIDRQFCRDCVTGKEKAWASYFANDGFMVPGDKKEDIRGLKAIEKAMKPIFSLPNLKFEWEPEYCEISEDGTLAVTKGHSKLSYTKDGDLIEKTGHYTTIWKKVKGIWKISWDIGN